MKKKEKRNGHCAYNSTKSTVLFQHQDTATATSTIFCLVSYSAHIQCILYAGGSVAKWLGCWACNLVVPGSSPPPCYSLDLFLVAPSSAPWLYFVNNQLVCLLPVGIFNHSMFIYNVSFLFVCTGPEKPHWGSGQSRFYFMTCHACVE